MKKLLDEFKAFILKGNVIDLAVGIIIGAAFKTIVDSMVGDIMGPIAKVISQQGHLVDIMNGFGKFGGAILNFLILAAVVFFVFVKPMNALMARIKRGEEAPPPPPPTAEVILLTEIRDIMKGGNPPSSPSPTPPAA
jgi:large conductance mechanosensitive channel